MKKTVLITGGAGFIGTHACVTMIEAGWNVVVVDNLSNSNTVAIKRVKKLCEQEIPFYRIDIADEIGLTEVFKKHSIDLVMHFAGLKAVGESVAMPIAYFKNNIGGTVSLLNVMEKNNCYSLIFSSSATVYGASATSPIIESSPLSATNPYGTSKLLIESILLDLYRCNNDWNIGILRYFNPVGAHQSGEIGESPKGTPNNLMPYIAKTAIGEFPFLKIFGNDYPTIDGTGVRDYIHVIDLVEGHLAMAEFLQTKTEPKIINLGRGQGYSVLQVLKIFEEVSGKTIKFKIHPQREGDVAECFADVQCAKIDLGWQAKHNLYQMCSDVWNWQLKNPKGYENI